MAWMNKNSERIGKLTLLPVGEILPNPNQPRRCFDQQELDKLSRSIAANGLLQPISVRRLDRSSYELIAGERRLLACKALGMDKIPAIVVEMPDTDSAVMALVENLHRTDLNCFEEAEAIAKLMADGRLTQQQVAKMLCKTQPAIANKLRLLRISPTLRDLLVQNGLTERHARALLMVEDPQQQEEILHHVIKMGLNVAQTESYIQRCLKEVPQEKSSRLVVVKDVRLLFNSISKAVNAIKEGGFEVETMQTEDDRYVNYVVRIPKDRVYVKPMDNATA